MKCANTSCSREERYFRSGTLYAIDCALSEQRLNGKTAGKRIVWLCESCSRNFRVQTWRPPGEQIHSKISKRAGVKTVHEEMDEVTSSAA